jgi:hypothetical protein
MHRSASFSATTFPELRASLAYNSNKLATSDNYYRFKQLSE